MLLMPFEFEFSAAITREKGTLRINPADVSAIDQWELLAGMLGLNNPESAIICADVRVTVKTSELTSALERNKARVAAVERAVAERQEQSKQ